MRTRSPYGGRHELGQNFLTHPPTIDRIVELVRATEGAILEIGAGGGALTAPLARLDRDLAAIDLDEHRVRALRRRLPHVRIDHADALRHPLDRPVVVGNIPFHLTTPILRRLLSSGCWQHAVLVTQWEVARKRAGVGGATMMTARAAPWFEFALHGRVPARAFRPMPAVDGGILGIARRRRPLLPRNDAPAYERFVGAVFTGRGHGIAAILRGTGIPKSVVHGLLAATAIPRDRLPRDLGPEDWAALWRAHR